MLRLFPSLLSERRLSHWVALYLRRLYTHVRAKTTGVSIYLFSISEAILPVHGGLEDESGGLGLGERENRAFL